MKSSRWLATCLALALAGSMVWTEAGWAQGRGGGPRGVANQDSQGAGPDRGPNYQTCPNYPGFQNCPQGQGIYPQGRRGARRGGRANQPTPQTNQTNPSEATQ